MELELNSTREPLRDSVEHIAHIYAFGVSGFPSILGWRILPRTNNSLVLLSCYVICKAVYHGKNQYSDKGKQVLQWEVLCVEV